MLLKDKADINRYSEANQSLYFETLKTSIEIAQSDYILPVIGQTQFDTLDAGWNADPVNLSPTETLLLEGLQKALVSYSLYEYAPIGEVQITDSGLSTSRTPDNPGAFKYQVQNLRNALLSRAHKYLEDALEYMEDNIASFPDWVASDEFKEYRSLFIGTGKEFKMYYTNLAHPRQLYMRLLPSFQLIEQLTISPTIGDNFFQSLKSRAITDNPAWTSYEIQFLDYLKKAIAYLTINEGIPHLNVRIDKQGITIVNPEMDSTASNGKRKTAEDNHLAMLITKTFEIGQRWLFKAMSYLNDNAQHFPDYDPDHNKPSEEECTTCNCTPCECSTIQTTNSAFSM